MKGGLCEVISEHRRKSQEASHANISGRKGSGKKKRKCKGPEKGENLCLWLVWAHKEENIGYTTESRQGPDHGSYKPR